MVNKRMQEASSPYLRLQADSPVEWYQWNEEAFSRAQREDKPIFLSVGYAACHYCELMARESFADQEIARQLNESFVPIKVDREELGEVDFVYMLAVQNMTGRAGWPMTLFLTPEKEPFYAATYLPKTGYSNVPGLEELMPVLAQVWEKDRGQVRKNAQDIVAYLKNYIKIKQPADSYGSHRINSRILEEGFERLASSFDTHYGGFVPAPKFPMPQNLMFLLRYGVAGEAEEALAMVRKTLDNMYQGGLYDHIGFGFFRYSTDPIWLAPHFEKMLLDNCGLLLAYLWGYHYLGDSQYARIAKETISYILSELQAPAGGFYSSEAADADGKEGAYYLWSEGEAEQVLGDEGQEFITLYNMDQVGRFNNRKLPNLLYHTITNKQRRDIEPARQKLLAHRAQRVRPFIDSKILTGANGMLVAALATAGKVFQDSSYVEQAEKLGDFILTNLLDNQGRLYRFMHDQQKLGTGLAQDYNAVIWGLIELYQASLNSRWLQAAVELNRVLLDDFYDEQGGGLFYYSRKTPELLIRPYDFYDTALASDNALATYNFMRLARLLNNQELFTLAEKQLRLFNFEVASNPAACGFWLYVYTCYFFQGKELILLGEAQDEALEDLLPIVQQDLTADWLVVLKSKSETDRLQELIKGLDRFEAHPHNEINAYLGCGFHFGRVINDIDTVLFALEASTFLLR